jgi:hypothetical protein
MRIRGGGREAGRRPFPRCAKRGRFSVLHRSCPTPMVLLASATVIISVMGRAFA